MKTKRFLFLFTISFLTQYSFTQTVVYDTLPVRTVIEVKHPQEVYRGIMNRLSIAVPYAMKTIITGNGLVALDSIGHYYLKPGTGNETTIDIKATMPDGTMYNETRILPIKNLSGVNMTVNGRDRIIDLSKKDLESAIVGYSLTGLYNVEIKLFVLELPNKKHLIVAGNQFDNASLKVLKKLHKGEVFSIIYAKDKDYIGDFCKPMMTPVKVLLID